ncbi:hypothetical protein BV25DRAFT_1918403 [Artomyces pyxidatus]|uniref:Uncharacterized protein n=1 Tax=Artomyces pyxidatus TaxID=48021 RepID=A0ACB8SSY2_9AGAM|nr:hypothetical protein BV25DRAFT_1918403 [Artomyces pyxidatus]
MSGETTTGLSLVLSSGPLNDQGLRVVQLPPETLDTCASRDAFKPKVRKNCSCGQVTYCSDKCQKDGWAAHKPSCVPTDQIDFLAFHHLLACLVEKSHNHRIKHRHKALTKTIINNPARTLFPDGWEAVPVILRTRPSKPLSDPFVPDAHWWPGGPSPRIRRKLCHRIRREGFVLPILTAVCFALLAEVYTASCSPEESPKRRLRLRYSTAPVADFGICAGQARVKPHDKLVYIDEDTHVETHGQDRDDHYWIYFRTTRGENIVLDCAMFTFKLNVVVLPGEFAPRSYGPPSFNNSHTERARRSVLRDAALQEAARRSGTQEGFTAEDVEALVTFMRELAHGEVTTTERQLVAALMREHVSTLRGVLLNEEWKKYPARPEIAVMLDDPVELLLQETEQESEDFLAKKILKDKKRATAKARLNLLGCAVVESC